MGRLFAALIAAFSLVAPAWAAPREVAAPSLESALAWINRYRSEPHPEAVPEAVRAMSRLGAFKDPEAAGVYVGFVAGILNVNPAFADRLIGQMLPLPPEHQWALVRAIAYSGLPRWKWHLHRFAMHMPGRKAMIDAYLSGRLPTLDQLALEEEKPALFRRLLGYFGSVVTDAVRLEPSPDVVDTLWGFYFATGAREPIEKIAAMLPWSADANDVDRLTLGGMAKYTLATNAARDPVLLSLLKRIAADTDPKIKPILAEVVIAAETVDTAKIRKQALAAIEELKRKGPAYRREIAGWGQIGQGALALGCIAAAAGGQVALGLPCVVGGAVSSAALNYWSARQ